MECPSRDDSSRDVVGDGHAGLAFSQEGRGKASDAGESPGRAPRADRVTEPTAADNGPGHGARARPGTLPLRGLRVRREVHMLVSDILQRLATLDAAALCDADKDIRVMDAGLRPMTSFRQMAGRARTVRCRDEFLAVIRALHDAEP